MPSTGHPTAQTALLEDDQHKPVRMSANTKYILLVGLVVLITVVLALSLTGNGAAADDTAPPADINPDDVMDYYVLDDNLEAMCNDGSPPAFFFMAGDPESTEWVILLEGHECCSDDQSCSDRIDKFGIAALSTLYDDGYKNLAGFGILSPHEEENAHFYTAHKVFPRYCSSDSWVGNSLAGEDGNDSEYHFMGSAILDAIMAELSANFGLADATSIILTGEGSMGNMGAYLNSDRIQADLAPTLFPNAQLTGITDLGWFMEADCFDGRNATVCGPIPILVAGLAAWNAVLPDWCSHFPEDSQWQCWFPEYWINDLQTPTFHFQDVYDWGFLWGEGVVGPVDDSNSEYVEAFAQLQRDTILAAGVGSYLPDCSSHGVLTISSWYDLLVSDISPEDAFWEFYNDHSYMGPGADDYGTFVGNPTCAADIYSLSR